MEKIKILLVEDDPKQITWAKKVFEHDELRVYENWHDFYNRENLPTDFVITDLSIPRNNHNEKESLPTWGLSVFGRCINLLKNKEIKGLALVTNFEHHWHKMKEVEIKLFYSIQQIVESLGKKVERSRETKELFLQENNFLNMVFLFDCNVLVNNVMSPEGEMLTREECIDRENLKEEMFAARLLCEKGYVNLKPYKEVLDILR